MVSVDDYTKEVECEYKGERYSVRDNGAVFRHPKNGKVRKYDNYWTFGKKNDKGYMVIASVVIHIIVAHAFLGNPPTDKHVVDHIDTNRCNNRADNLRWVTRLENILLNPVTCRRIEQVCGSVENFLENPSKYRDKFDLEPNISWMRSVTENEAKATLENLKSWAESEGEVGKGALGEWVFRRRERMEGYMNSDNASAQYIKEKRYGNRISKEQLQELIEAYKPPATRYEETKVTLTESLTHNALQKNWYTPTTFLCCPETISDTPLRDYANRLKEGAVFCENKYGSSITERVAVSDDYILVITSGDNIKSTALAKITFKDGKFIHESLGSFFDPDAALKRFTLEQGLEWEGGEVFDDYC